MSSDSDNIWKCKCGCVSKQSHRSRWAFISRYRKNCSFRYTDINLNINKPSSSSLINKLTLGRKNIHTNTEYEQTIFIKKVKFDEKTKKIIIETDDIETNNLDVNNQMINDMVEINDIPNSNTNTNTDTDTDTNTNINVDTNTSTHKYDDILMESDLIELRDLLGIE